MLLSFPQSVDNEALMTSHKRGSTIFDASKACEYMGVCKLPEPGCSSIGDESMYMPNGDDLSICKKFSLDYLTEEGIYTDQRVWTGFCLCHRIEEVRD